MDAAYWKQHGRTVKGRLTRAERGITGAWPAQPVGEAVRFALDVVASTREAFDIYGYPDWWSRVDRLETDALYWSGRLGD